MAGQRHILYVDSDDVRSQLCIAELLLVDGRGTELVRKLIDTLKSPERQQVRRTGIPSGLAIFSNWRKQWPARLRIPGWKLPLHSVRDCGGRLFASRFWLPRVK
jgi:hypothetical protein